jgi:predicted nucleic acid-binding protein
MIAVDTNVLVYRIDRGEPVKQGKAQLLLRRLAAGAEPTVIPWQVLCELVRQLRYWQDKKQLTRDAMLRYAAGFRALFPVVMPTVVVLDRALDLSARYSLSHWDSVLLGACLEANAATLYTEDMGAPCVYDGLQLINPFT